MTQIIPSDFDIAAEDSTEFDAYARRGQSPIADHAAATDPPQRFSSPTGSGDLPDGDFLDRTGRSAWNRLAISRVWWFSTVWKGGLRSPYAHGLIEGQQSARLARRGDAFSRLQRRQRSSETHFILG